MSEDNTESLNGSSTNPTPFEAFVRQQFELLNSRMDALRAEMVERFVQVSRQTLEVRDQVSGLKEDIRDLNDKVDVFVRENLRIKRDLREIQDSLSPKN
ncbi:MAG TPA: hypothetical protein VFD58_23755 [Blastocatellia bacterium]|nr:hypothetical protein [Blastocatellia bacterium]